MIGGILGGPLGGAPDARCSSAGCDENAGWRVSWRNPRIHEPERVKVWLACDGHREHLSRYLSTRGFPVVVSGVDDPVELVPDAADQGLAT